MSPTLCALPAERLAPRLLGCVLKRDEVALRITETEGYFWPGDSACHARAGRTARNAPMWQRGGHAYIYLCYGLHHLLNVSCDREGIAAAVLIRAAEPLAGHDTIAARRGRPLAPSVLAGPGKVGQALALETALSGHDLLRPGGLELMDGPRPAEILATPRIGIGYADPLDIARPLRFVVAGTKWVSKPKALARSGRRSWPAAGGGRNRDDTPSAIVGRRG